MKRPVAEQVIVVSGASSGIGRASRGPPAGAARRSSSRRATPRRSAHAVGEIEACGGEALAVPGDATSEADAESLCARAVERFGRIDTFVATVMVTVYAEVEQLEPEELRRVLDVNFLGRAHAYRAALPHLQGEPRARSSTSTRRSPTAASRSRPPTARRRRRRARSSSRRASSSRSNGAGVDICLILPGAINTPQFDRARQKLGLQPQPVPPIYQPEIVAEAILRCAERPERELPVTWGAQKLLWGQKLSPRAGDLVLLRNGWKGQTTGEPKPVDSPDNLWETIPGDPGAHGRFDDARAGVERVDERPPAAR